MNQDQYEFLNDRIDHTVTEHDALAERVLLLESDREVKRSRTLEIIVIILILVEIGQGFFSYFHHG